MTLLIKWLLSTYTKVSPFVVSLSPKGIYCGARTTLRQAQGERKIQTNFRLCTYINSLLLIKRLADKTRHLRFIRYFVAICKKIYHRR